MKNGDKRIKFEKILSGENVSFCLAPWIHSFVNSKQQRRLCCLSLEQEPETEFGTQVPFSEYWNSPFLKQTRKAMMNGETISACDFCTLNEKVSPVYKSFFNESFNDIKENYLNATDEDGHLSLRPCTVDYRPSNLCNFKCRTCGSGNSSAWEKEDGLKNRMPVPKKGAVVLDDDGVKKELFQFLENKNMRDIYWAGGEPLLMKYHWDVMSEIIRLGFAHDVSVRYNTNLSVIAFRDKNLISDILPHFREVEIRVSMDGYGKTAEYIRTGLIWDTWVSNLRKLLLVRSDRVRVVIDFTMTLPGLLDLESFIDFVNSVQVLVECKIVFVDEFNHLLSPFALPSATLIDVIDELLKNEQQKLTEYSSGIYSFIRYLRDGETNIKNAHLFDPAVSKKRMMELDEKRKTDTSLDYQKVLSKNKNVAAWWNSIAVAEVR